MHKPLLLFAGAITGVLAGAAPRLAAQSASARRAAPPADARTTGPAARADAPTESPAPGRWQLGVYPTLHKLPAAVAPTHVWGGGATLAGSYALTRAIAVEGALSGGWTPQLNTDTQGALNELTPSLSVQWTAPAARALRPYLTGGVGYEWFRFDQDVDTLARTGGAAVARVGAGVRAPLGERTTFRAEVHGNAAGDRRSVAGFTGVALTLGAPRRAARPVVAVAVRPDTVRLVDTVTVRVVDTVRVERVVTRTDTVARTVTEQGETAILVLRDAYFDTGRAELRPEAYGPLARVASELNARATRDVNVTIVGHTDDVGAAESNERLGLARAASVRDYLVMLGIPARRMSTGSGGEREPIASNRTASGRAQNRRVVISRAQ